MMTQSNKLEKQLAITIESRFNRAEIVKELIKKIGMTVIAAH